MKHYIESGFLSDGTFTDGGLLKHWLSDISYWYYF